MTFNMADEEDKEASRVFCSETSTKNGRMHRADGFRIRPKIPENQRFVSVREGKRVIGTGEIPKKYREQSLVVTLTCQLS